ncbi:hypothetical protein DERF_008653 [Dermatophagoides farinae]|uniref:Uncharacterized protein n=1 Tax=Dermatophagoides farinae TaxID=6954 RepID=A0A922L5P4_DERFA|nr:hypothetical protein DERF_008653 [Dermatophagoides farinae]
MNQSRMIQSNHICEIGKQFSFTDTCVYSNNNNNYRLPPTELINACNPELYQHQQQQQQQQQQGMIFEQMIIMAALIFVHSNRIQSSEFDKFPIFQISLHFNIFF